jgi:zinc transporter ZupT
MLSVVFVELIPHTIDLWLTGDHSREVSGRLFFPFGLVLGGYLLTQFFEHTIAPHIHLGEEMQVGQFVTASSAYTATAGLMIHTFFDGVSISAAAQVDFTVGLLVFVAVLLHKFPEGFTIASIILAAGKGSREVIVATSLIGITTLVGVALFLFLGANTGFSVAYALPIATGVTLYVAASDLIPEVNHHGGKRPLVSIFVFAGVALFFLLHYILHSLFGS